MEIITPTPLPPAEVGARYSVVLQVAGGTAPYRWKCEPGLPRGLALDEETGEITGVPKRAEPLNTRYFTVRDSSGVPAAGRYLDLIVRQAHGLVILTENLPAAILGQIYDQSLQASGGRLNYSWSLLPGSSLPAGLRLEADGRIVGKPTAVTSEPSRSFEVEVNDASRPPLAARRPLGLAVNWPPMHVKTTVLPNAKANKCYFATLEAENGMEPFTWTGGPLPPGLFWSNGEIIGKPTAPTEGPMKITVTVRGARGETGCGDLSLVVEE